MGSGKTSSTEMLSGFSGFRSSKEESVSSGRGSKHELVQSHALATSLDDSGAGGFGEAEGSNGELGAFQKSLIISDGSDNNNSSVPKTRL